MSDILVRGLDPDTVERLKASAKRNGRSMSAVARGMIERELEREEREESFWERVERLRDRIGRCFDDSAPYMADARERGYRDNPE